MGGDSFYGADDDDTWEAAEGGKPPALGMTPLADIILDKHEKQWDGGWYVCSQNDKAIVAAKQMVKAGVGALVVLDPAKLGPEKHDLTLRRHIPTAAHAMVGIVSERDIVTKVGTADLDSHKVRVKEIMTPEDELHALHGDDPLIHAMQVMVDEKVRHVPVLSHQHILGLMSARDVMATLVEEHREEEEEIEEYLSGHDYSCKKCYSATKDDVQ